MRTALFGEVAADGAGTYVPRVADENGRTKRPSLYVADSLSPARIELAAEMIDELSSLEARARELLVKRVQSGDKLVVDFIAFHRDELDPETSRTLFGDGPTAAQTIARLELVGLGVRQDVLVLDFCFGKQLSDELLVVAFDRTRNVVGVTHES